MPADVMTPETVANANEPTPGQSKFLESMKTNIASIGQPPAGVVLQPPPSAAASPTPPAQPAAAPATPAAKPDAPAAPATPPAANADDDIPESFSNAKADNWKKLRQLRQDAETRAKTLAQQLKERETELVTLKAKPAVDPEFQAKLDALAKERDEYSALVERVSIENHPKFQAHYGARMEQAVAAAKDAAGPKADQVLAILEAPSSKWRKDALNAVYGEIESEADKFALAAAIQDFDRVREERKKHLDNSKTEAQKLREVEALEKADRDKKHAIVKESGYQEALTKAREFDAFKTIEGNQAHNDTVAANEKKLRQLITGEGLTKEAYINAQIMSAEAERLKAANEALTKERDELKAAVAALNQANPGVRGGQQQNGNPVVATPYGDSQFMGTFRQGLREAGL